MPDTPFNGACLNSESSAPRVRPAFLPSRHPSLSTVPSVLFVRRLSPSLTDASASGSPSYHVPRGTERIGRAGKKVLRELENTGLPFVNHENFSKEVENDSIFPGGEKRCPRPGRTFAAMRRTFWGRGPKTLSLHRWFFLTLCLSQFILENGMPDGAAGHEMARSTGHGQH